MMENYVGIENDLFGGMTDQGRIIRDAWVFGLLPESEGCAGWNLGQIQELYEKVYAEWERHGHIPSRLPDGLRERYVQFYDKAVLRARAHGWDPEMGEDD
ncbi:MAG: hypothetical protein ABL902_08290 [Gallionella sp.]